jgi:hypothetical protein
MIEIDKSGCLVADGFSFVTVRTRKLHYFLMSLGFFNMKKADAFQTPHQRQ